MWRPALHSIVSIGLVALLLACGASEEAPERTEAPAVVVSGGQYEVTGVTIGSSTGAQRPVQGRVSLVISGDAYTTHFELNTVFPGSEPVPAQVVGTGEGSIAGSQLTGTAVLQVVASTVPGVDVGFAMVPHSVSSRVRSTSEAEFFADGSVRIELENEGVEGEDYEPTKTHLVGYRLEDS